MTHKNLVLSYFSLFTSFGTLFCCALPSLFVVLGMGATVAGFVGFVPQIVILSEYKIWVFAASGVLITSSLFWLYSQRNAPCPIDPHLALSCKVARKWSVRVTLFSAGMWTLGFGAAYILPFFAI